jgi:hypothetical protein
VYEALCAIVPGLQNRLLDSESDENVLHIADLVSVFFIEFYIHTYKRIYPRFRRALLALELTIQKV